MHDRADATKANGFGGLDAELTINNPLVVRHIAQLAEWQNTKVFDYSGRGQSAEPRFQNGECGIFIGSSATRADILRNAKFEVGYGMLPYWPDVAGRAAKQHHRRRDLVGAARPAARANIRASQSSSPSCRSPRCRPPGTRTPAICRSPAPPTTSRRAQGFYDRNPGAAISIEQMTLKPPTENSKGVRLGSFVLVRDAIEDELELVFAGKKSAQAGSMPPSSAATACCASSSAPIRTG